jgi:hypothetical protein
LTFISKSPLGWVDAAYDVVVATLARWSILLDVGQALRLWRTVSALAQEDML